MSFFKGRMPVFTHLNNGKEQLGMFNAKAGVSN